MFFVKKKDLIGCPERFYIEQTADLTTVCVEGHRDWLVPGREIEDISNGEKWILRSDGNWRKFGTNEVYNTLVNIKWDGEQADVTNEVAGLKYYRVSKDLVSREELVGTTCVADTSSGQMTVTLTDDNLTDYHQDDKLIYTTIAVNGIVMARIYYNTYTHGTVHMPIGIYFCKYNYAQPTNMYKFALGTV